MVVCGCDGSVDVMVVVWMRWLWCECDGCGVDVMVVV